MGEALLHLHLQSQELARDLTDAMYNPAKPPYVGHDAGTGLVVEYIEKFWCPTIRSEDLTRVSGQSKEG